MIDVMGSLIPTPPHLSYLGERRLRVCDSVVYSDSGQVLDVWVRDGRRGRRRHDAPVLIWVPGGAWLTGSRRTMQGHALMSALVKRGWICLSIDYRTAPRHRWPAPLDDVRAAVAWARTHIGEYGGDPGFVVVAGASAGGHLATLAGLDGITDGVVSFYGSYDWQFDATPWRRLFMGFLQLVVVGKSAARHRQLFADSSPMELVTRRAAPPMMMIHGTRDRLISVKEARRFHKLLIAASTGTVSYLELPTGHGFDLLDHGHCERAVRETCRFLNRLRRDSRVKAVAG